MSTVRRDRRIALIVGGLIAVGATLSSAVQVAGWTVGTVEHASHRVIPGPVRELQIDAGKGDVTVIPASGRDVTIDGRAEGALHKPRLRVAVDGSDVEVKGGCSGFTFWRCSARIVVHVPAGTAVSVKAHSGEISASGIDGPVRLVTSSGDVRADALSGSAYLKTSSGEVVARGLTGPAELQSSSGDVLASRLGVAGAVRAHTSSGDVVLRFVAPPSDADASTSSGDVFIGVPRGAESYRVDADSDSGDREVGVRTDPAASRILRARTSSGDAVVAYGD